MSNGLKAVRKQRNYNEVPGNNEKLSNEQLITKTQPGEDISNNMLLIWQQEQLKAVVWPLSDALKDKQPEVIRSYRTPQNLIFIVVLP